MKTALISDIHSNLEALETCLEYIEMHAGIDRIVCIGDIIGYGADPVACLDLVMEKSEAAVIGNHDSAVIKTTPIFYFNNFAREAVLWTQSQISDVHVKYLEGLPYSVSKDNILLSHATPDDPAEWNYIFSWNDTIELFSGFDESICFVGHSHVPGIYGEREQVAFESMQRIDLNRDEKYIINIGSVGQPRDGDSRLSFAVFDEKKWSIEIIRLEYDIETAGNKIIEQGLPVFLAQRLIAGR